MIDPDDLRKFVQAADSGSFSAKRCPAAEQDGGRPRRLIWASRPIDSRRPARSGVTCRSNRPPMTAVHSSRARRVRRPRTQDRHPACGMTQVACRTRASRYRLCRHIPSFRDQFRLSRSNRRHRSLAHACRERSLLRQGSRTHPRLHRCRNLHRNRRRCAKRRTSPPPPAYRRSERQSPRGHRAEHTRMSRSFARIRRSARSPLP